MIRWCTNRLNLTIYPQIVSCYHWISHQVMWAVLRRQPVWSDEMDLSTDHMDISLWQPQSNRNKNQWLIQNRSVVHCRIACESFHLRPPVNETDQFREHSNLFITLHVPNERDCIGVQQNLFPLSQTWHEWIISQHSNRGKMGEGGFETTGSYEIMVKWMSLFFFIWSAMILCRYDIVFPLQQEE